MAKSALLVERVVLNALEEETGDSRLVFNLGLRQMAIVLGTSRSTPPEIRVNSGSPAREGR